MSAAPVAVVVLSHNRRAGVLHTVARMRAAYPEVPVCVVDNGSRDGAAQALAEHFPEVRVIGLGENCGAAARNVGARAVDARYIAFCDDDTWWAEGSLARAVDILDAHARLAVLTARILVGTDERPDPTSALMERSPIPNTLGFPGSEVAGIMAGAAIMRRAAFLAVGGYEPRFFIGCEERLLALDLMAAGWHLGYCPELVVHHHPSAARELGRRRRLLLRNALWCAWLRRSATGAWSETRTLYRQFAADPDRLHGFAAALASLPWVLRNRRPLPHAVEARLRLLEQPER